MPQYNPGSMGGNSDDGHNKDPRGADAPKYRLGEDFRQINAQD
ncbi:hypothetical protein OG874_00675 [Nocardia sp. NBC_00565]|nr:hypothetical protein [Nocardia sp. NBC_00565]WUC03770.1 hypothetical protein OG874_00675 [Nocardia sp. NBC_00565]